MNNKPRMWTMLIVVAGLAVLAAVLWQVLSSRGADSSGFDYGHTQRTLASGTPAKARVLSMRDTGGRLNSNPSIEFGLEVTPASGAPFKATTRAIVSVVALPRYQVGATIDVRYDPADLRSVAVVVN